MMTGRRHGYGHPTGSSSALSCATQYPVAESLIACGIGYVAPQPGGADL
jgi:hypothetical protein